MAALAGRQASLRESLVDQVDTSAYPTYDKEFAHLKLNACFDKFVGLAGNQIDANTNIDGVSNALHDCLSQGGMRYSQNTFNSLKIMIQNIAVTKANVLKAVSEVSQSLVTLQKDVGETEEVTQDGFDAADLGIMATALNAGDNVLKRGGQRAEEAESTKSAALTLKQILDGADNGRLNADAGKVKTAVQAVQAAAAALEQAKSDLHNQWCGGSGYSPADACCNGGMTLSATDPGRTSWQRCAGANIGVRSIIFNNYAEVESCDGELAVAGGCADIEAATQAQTNGGECYTDFDCAGNGAHAANRSNALVSACTGAALAYYDNNVQDWNIDYEQSTKGNCAAYIAPLPEWGPGDDPSCDANSVQSSADDLDAFAAKLSLGEVSTPYATDVAALLAGPASEEVPGTHKNDVAATADQELCWSKVSAPGRLISYKAVDDLSGFSPAYDPLNPEDITVEALVKSVLPAAAPVADPERYAITNTVSHPVADQTAALATAINAWCDAVIVALGAEAGEACALEVIISATNEYSINVTSINDILERGFNEVDVSADLYVQEQRLYARDVLEQVVSDVSTELTAQVRAVSNVRYLVEQGEAGANTLAARQTAASAAMSGALSDFAADEANAACTAASGVFSLDGQITATCSDAQEAALLEAFNTTLNTGDGLAMPPVPAPVEELRLFKCAINACDALADCDHTSSVVEYDRLVVDIRPKWATEAEVIAAGFPVIYADEAFGDC